MAEIRFTRPEPKLRNVPIAVTPEGFWCCPAPIVFQKTVKPPSPPLNKPKPTSPPSPPPPPKPKKQTPNNENPSNPPAKSDDQKSSNVVNPTSNAPRKLSIEFGESGTSNLKVVLRGKHGLSVKLNVHKEVVAERSTLFAEKLSAEDSAVASLEIDECEDVEAFVETVGLMYSQEMKLRLIKQSVRRVLRILTVAEAIGFGSCIQSCVDYLEAVPWVGEEEEDKVVSSLLQLQSKCINGVAVSPILKRVASDAHKPHKETLSHILDLVLKSTDEKGRREMKSVVLNLLKHNNNNNNNPECDLLAEVGYETLYNSCRSCLCTLVSLFKEAASEGIGSCREAAIKKHIALEADNMLWLLEILVERRAADEVSAMWADQDELAALHGKIPTVARFHVSCVTARLLIGIGKGEILARKETRQRLVETWLEPLMGDYRWLQHGCGSLDRKAVEEGIGRTILTLPMEVQQRILMAWMARFMKCGDGCPDLNNTFQVWWRRTFVRPQGEVTERRSRRPLSYHFMATDEGVD